MSKNGKELNSCNLVLTQQNFMWVVGRDLFRPKLGLEILAQRLKGCYAPFKCKREEVPDTRGIHCTPSCVHEP